MDQFTKEGRKLRPRKTAAQSQDHSGFEKVEFHFGERNDSSNEGGERRSYGENRGYGERRPRQYGENRGYGEQMPGSFFESISLKANATVWAVVVGAIGYFFSSRAYKKRKAAEEAEKNTEQL